MTEHKEVGEIEISEDKDNWIIKVGNHFKIQRKRMETGSSLPLSQDEHAFCKLAQALSLPNKSNEEIVEEFKKEFYEGKFNYHNQEYGKDFLSPHKMFDWLHSHLTQREIKLPEKVKCKSCENCGIGEYICHCFAINETIDLCQQAIERSG